MHKLGLFRILLAACALTLISTASAQGPAQGADFDTLKGAWVRPDGGYTITIKSVAADGKIEAMYANPRPLPF